MTPDQRLYLDWNASTPLAAEVVLAMREALEVGWANPASVHAPGRRARALVEDARDAVAALVGFDRRETILTGGGTEANNLALELVAASGPATLVVGRIEHPSVLRPAEHLATRGVHVRWVEPDAEGNNKPKPGDIYALHYPEPTKPEDNPKDGISHVGIINTMLMSTTEPRLVGLADQRVSLADVTV